MTVFWIVLQQEILLSFRNFGKVLAGFLFFLISFFVFSIIVSKQQNQDLSAFFSTAIIWFSLLSCLLFSTAEFLKKDFKDGSIEQAFLACENFEIFILAKMLGNWLFYCLPILLSTIAILFLHGFESDFIWNFLALISLASLAINFICSFCGSLSMLGNSAPMIGIIALPLTIPILLIACLASDYTALETSLENFQNSFNLLFGITIFLGCIAVFATTKIVRITME